MDQFPDFCYRFKETLDYNIMKPEEKRMINMFQYTVWQKSYDQCGFSLPEEGILKIRKSGVLFDEILELLKYNLSSIDFIDRTYDAGFESPLDVYCRYTRDQILVAMDFMNPQNVREGVRYLPGWNTEILFVTLNKSEKDFTQSTLYRDYSISDSLFHWQSQSTTSEESKVGQRYINQKKNKARILLFVREEKENTSGSFPYTFLGPVEYLSHEGSKPMSIVWNVLYPTPPRFLEKTSKLLAV